MKLDFTMPYDTTIMKFNKNQKLELEMKKYAASLFRPDDLNYNCSFTNAMFYVIVGKNEDELSLPTFTLPYHFQNIRNQFCIAIDARSLCRKVENPNFEIEDLIRDKNNYNFLVTAGFLVAEVKDKDSSLFLKPVMNQYITAFTSLMSTTADKIITLHPVDKIKLEIAFAVYAYSLFNFHINLAKPIETEACINYLANRHYSIDVPRETVKSVVENILKSYNHSAVGLNRLELIINSVIPEDYRRLINVKVINEVLANSWQGFGGKDMLYASLECFPLFIAILFNIGENNFLKKNNYIGKIVDKNERFINNKELVRFIKNLVNSSNGRLLD